MELLYTFASPPSPCGYLPDQTWSLRYELVRGITADEYGQRMLRGWRRFGHALFRPECPSCRRCLPLRIDVGRFAPSRSMKRVAKLNAGLKDELVSKGMQFNDPDPALFREALRKAGSYAEWKKKYGDEAWAILEKSVGTSLA